MALWLSAATLAATAVYVSATGGPADADVTQLWMLPEPGGARLGVYNGTASPARYQLVIRPAGQAGTTLVIDVPPGDRWEQDFPFPADWSTQEVEATLYREGQSAPFRTTFLVPAPSASP